MKAVYRGVRSLIDESIYRSRIAAERGLRGAVERAVAGRTMRELDARAEAKPATKAFPGAAGAFREIRMSDGRMGGVGGVMGAQCRWTEGGCGFFGG